MTRRSLRPQLNQIRSWVRQGRTDAWIAHQLEVPVQQIQAFKRENELEADGETDAAAFDDDVDLRAEDDAKIAAELEDEARKREEEAKKAADEAKKQAERERRAARRKAKKEEDAAAAAAAEAEAAGGEVAAAPAADEPEEKPKKRRTSTRRKKAATPAAFEGTFDHGEEGYGLWLDPAVQDDGIYAEHWAGHRSIEVTIEEDQIVIKRVGSE